MKPDDIGPTPIETQMFRCGDGGVLYADHHVVTVIADRHTYYECTKCGLQAKHGADIAWMKQNPCDEYLTRQVMES
jgi:hypothetical protein